MTSQESVYVTRDELAARMAEFELRIVDRLAQLERRMDEHFRTQTRWIVGLIGGLYAAVALAALVFALSR